MLNNNYPADPHRRPELLRQWPHSRRNQRQMLRASQCNDNRRVLCNGGRSKQSQLMSGENSEHHGMRTGLFEDAGWQLLQ
jgi:hypothetical protein